MPPFLLLFLTLFTLPAAPLSDRDEPPSPTFVLPQTDVRPTLADFTSGRPPSAFMEVAAFRQRDPDDGAPATLRTRAFLAADEAHLYVAFLCYDRPEDVRARMAPREQISGDDRIAIYLDTFFDRRQAYVFEVSAGACSATGSRRRGPAMTTASTPSGRARRG